MNSITPIQQSRPGKPGFPLRLFAATFVISLLTAAFSGWQTWHMHERFQELSYTRAHVTEDIGRIMLFDEILTMSARMAAATGEFAYETRYDEVDAQLTAVINHVKADLPQADIARHIRVTDEANLALVKMERQAFALTHQGKLQQATALLNSAEYLGLKKVYAGGMEKSADAMLAFIEMEQQRIDTLTELAEAANAVGILVLLAAWFFAARSARSWAAERWEGEEALRKAHDELEDRVEQRTADLASTNEQLQHEIAERKIAEAELKNIYDEVKAAQDASLSIMEDMDIQRKKLEAANREKDALISQVARINKELNDFAYIVSHDLKAPLRAISQLADWLAEDYTNVLDDAGKETLKILKNRTVRMHSMIEGILQFSRVGRVEGKPEVVDTDKLVKQIVDSLAPPENIRIAVQDGLPQVTFDPLRIDQIFQNLISNAIKYMDKPEGLIEIGCRDADSFHEFFVKDNGPGIEERHFERIFQIFQTLAARDEYESTGIGLSIVKKIIEQNGGRIWIESEVGKGSTFRFTIPKGKTPPTSSPPL